jgi:hypothetical protein
MVAGRDESGISDGSKLEILVSLGENYEVDSFSSLLSDRGYRIQTQQ